MILVGGPKIPGDLLGWVCGRKSLKKLLGQKITGNLGLEMAPELDFGRIFGAGPQPSANPSPPFFR